MASVQHTQGTYLPQLAKVWGLYQLQSQNRIAQKSSICFLSPLLLGWEFTSLFCLSEEGRSLPKTYLHICLGQSSSNTRWSHQNLKQVHGLSAHCSSIYVSKHLKTWSGQNEIHICANMLSCKWRRSSDQMSWHRPTVSDQIFSCHFVLLKHLVAYLF